MRAVVDRALAPSREERRYKAILWGVSLAADLVIAALALWQIWANRPENLYAKAIALAEEGRYARAEFLLNNIIERHPESPYAEKAQIKIRQLREERATKGLKRGLASFQAGNGDAAEAECKRIEAAYSDISAGREAKALREHIRKRREEGVAFTSAAILYDDAEVSYKTESYEDALAKFQLVRRLYPKSEFAERAVGKTKEIEARLRDSSSVIGNLSSE